VRVLFDTNILISYLLVPNGQSPPVVAVQAAFARAFVLLVTVGILEELTRKVATKPYLARRIEERDLAEFTAAILAVAEAVPELSGPLPTIVRDAKDDHVLAYAIAGRADYLVTGDDDLLALGTVSGVTMIGPAEFVLLLENGAQR
jgi:putative PIN family toxin of toxin-antitoxin system